MPDGDRRRPALPSGMTPRLLCKEAAAAYCSIDPGTFETLGLYPTVIGPYQLWDKMVLDNREHIFSGMLMQRPPKKPDGPTPCVYLIQGLPGSPVKIGYVRDRRWVRGRIADLQTGSPYALNLLGTVSGGGAETEAMLHRFFAAYRLMGEWFEYAEPLQRFAAALAEGLPLAAALARVRGDA